MKKIINIIFTVRRTSALLTNLTRDLRAVFGDTIEIRNIYLDTLAPGEKIDGDVILLMRSGVIPQVKPHIADAKKIVVVTRTVSEAAIYSIYDLPKELKVLVVNDSPETTNETIAMLYQLGITHLKLIPYLGAQTDLSEVTFAITPGESQLVPPGIEHILDLGDRRLDIQTFLDLFSLLNITSDEVKQALIRYTDGNIELRNGVKKRYVQNYIMNETLKQVIGLENTGVLVTDMDYKVSYWNPTAERLLERSLKPEGCLSSYLTKEQFAQLSSPGFSGDLMRIQGREIMVSRVVLRTMKQETGYCMHFEPAAQIRKSGSELSRRLKNQGLTARYCFADILYTSEAMEQCIHIAKKVAATDYTVLITGATGTGKEMFAQALHNYSGRRDKPFVAVNCAALPENLLESELFGYEEGAFTGARRGGHLGLFEQADQGTIFLDEIGDMPYALQSKLLRVLQEHQIVRLGGNSVIDINVRIITATNCDLREAILRRNFREDLFYRLNVFPLAIVPLTKRKEDILLIFLHLAGVTEDEISAADKRKLLEYNWPGNIRELKNAAEYFKLMGNVDCIDVFFSSETKDEKMPVTAAYPAELYHLPHVLRIIRGHTEKGETLGRNSLLSCMEKEGVRLSEKKAEKMMAFLSAHGYILRGRGRAGIVMTEEGSRYLQELEKENKRH